MSLEYMAYTIKYVFIFEYLILLYYDVVKCVSLNNIYRSAWISKWKYHTIHLSIPTPIPICTI